MKLCPECGSPKTSELPAWRRRCQTRLARIAKQLDSVTNAAGSWDTTRVWTRPARTGPPGKACKKQSRREASRLRKRHRPASSGNVHPVCDGVAGGPTKRHPLSVILAEFRVMGVRR